MSWNKLTKPAANQPITSAWGVGIMDACIPQYSSLTALNAGWTDAPEGAAAHCTDVKKTYRRRGGVWLLPLENTQGTAIYQTTGMWTQTNFAVPADTQGVAVAPGGLGAFSTPTGMKGNRTYLVGLRGRFSNVTGTNQILTIVVNATATGKDTPLTTYTANAPEFANGQRVFDAAQVLPFVGCVWKGSQSAILVTGGTDDAALGVRWELVLASSLGANNYSVSETVLTVVDIGPAF